MGPVDVTGIKNFLLSLLVILFIWGAIKVAMKMNDGDVNKVLKVIGVAVGVLVLAALGGLTVAQLTGTGKGILDIFTNI